jgi:hypothetical protein
MMGIMQAELQQKRQWVSKERFIEGLSERSVHGPFESITIRQRGQTEYD